MELQVFERIGLISSAGLLHAFKKACDNKAIHEAAGRWIFSYVMKYSAATAPTTCFSLRSKSSRYGQNIGILTSYSQVVNHSLGMYYNDGRIAKVDANIVRITQPLKMSPFEFTDGL